MRLIDQLHLGQLVMGVRFMRHVLLRQSVHLSRRDLGTLMRSLDIQAMCPQPDTSKRHPRHKVYPYFFAQ